jgi:hypothetical protein
MPRRARALGLAVSLALGLASGGARAQTKGASKSAHQGGADPNKAACAEAYEAGQELRAGKKLRGARDRFVACSAPTCPGEMQKECTTWLAEIDAATPTLVLAARAPDGQDAPSTRVTIDDAPAAITGAAVPIDPGEHRVRFELAPWAPVERTFVVVEGEKLRRVDAAFVDPSASRRPAWPMYTAAGVGAVGLISFAALGIAGASQYGDLHDSCAPNCSPGDASSVRTKLLVADVSLGVGIAGLAVATVLFFTRPKSAPSAAVARGLSTGGATLTF